MFLDDLYLNGLFIDWSQISRYSYLRNIDSLRNIYELEFHKPITFFVGENGSGKSTLLEAIAVEYGFNPEGGTRNYNFSTFDSHSELCSAIRLSKGYRKPKWGYFLRSESFYNVATADEKYGKQPGGVSHDYHKMSHGESFLEVLEDNFSSQGIYFFDEPEAALSPQKQMTLLFQIAKCADAGSQFIIATHSPILMSIPNAEILSFDDNHIHVCSYEETGSYRITEMFINHRNQILKHLLD